MIIADGIELNGMELFCSLPDAGPWKLTFFDGELYANSQVSGLYRVDQDAKLTKIKCCSDLRQRDAMLLMNIEEFRAVILSYVDNGCEGTITKYRRDDIVNAKTVWEMLDAIFWAGDEQGASNAMVDLLR